MGLTSSHLVQSGQDMLIVGQNTVKGTINAIIDVVHQGSFIGHIIFFWSGGKN